MSTRARKVYAYRLVVDIPSECLKPGWAPEDWEAEYASDDWGHLPVFTWPPRRLYFNVESAHRRAYKLAAWGATVRTERILLEEWEPLLTYHAGGKEVSHA